MPRGRSYGTPRLRGPTVLGPVRVTVYGAAALTGGAASEVLADGVVTRIGAAALTGIGSSTIAGVRTRYGAASLSGTGTATIAGVRTVVGAASPTGTGTLSADGVVTPSGASGTGGPGYKGHPLISAQDYALIHQIGKVATPAGIAIAVVLGQPEVHETLRERWRRDEEALLLFGSP